jgi:DNA-binding transcriptional ArsR family regulator
LSWPDRSGEWKPKHRPAAARAGGLRGGTPQRRGFSRRPTLSKTERLTTPRSGAILNHMVEERADELSAVFRALGDPTRRAMLRRLAAGERTVGELAQPFRMSLAAASKHVKVLERAGLVRRTVRGRAHHCRLDAGRLAEAQQWLAFYQRFWTERLDALDALFGPEHHPEEESR